MRKLYQASLLRLYCLAHMNLAFRKLLILRCEKMKGRDWAVDVGPYLRYSVYSESP